MLKYWDNGGQNSRRWLRACLWFCLLCSDCSNTSTSHVVLRLCNSSLSASQYTLCVDLYIHNCSTHMPNGACYRTFGMMLSMYKMDVVFNKDRKLSILQIAGEKNVHSHYQGIQRHCNFFNGLCSIIMESRLNNIFL